MVEPSTVRGLRALGVAGGTLASVAGAGFLVASLLALFTGGDELTFIFWGVGSAFVVVGASAACTVRWGPSGVFLGIAIGFLAAGTPAIAASSVLGELAGQGVAMDRPLHTADAVAAFMALSRAVGLVLFLFAAVAGGVFALVSRSAPRERVEEPAETWAPAPRR